MKKALAACLALLMALPVFAACESTNPSPATTPVGNTDTTVAPAQSTEYPFNDKTFDGYEFSILVTGNMENMNDFEASEEAEDVVGSERYRWLLRTSEKYDISIVDIAELKFNSTKGGGPGYNRLMQVYRTGDTTYDAAMIGTYDVAQLDRSNVLTDLNSIEGLNLQNEWWDQRANEDMTIHGRMFYTTGDISLTDNQVTHCILFNKSLAKAIEDPYTLVKNDAWTFEKMSEMIREVSNDIDGNDVFDRNDKYGLLTWNDSMLQFLASGRERICSIDEDSNIVLTLYNERVVAMYDDYIELAKDTRHVFNYQVGTSSSDWDPMRLAMFDENRAMFYMTLFTTVPKHRDSEVDFGILPYPKYDETQSDYGHLISSFHSQFLCVPAFFESEEITASVLEYLAYTGKEQMTPAYYTKTLVGSHFRDEESGEMLDIIFASRVYDVGIYYNIGTYKDAIPKLYVGTGNVTLTKFYNAFLSKANKELSNLNESYTNQNN